ncbi:MAG: glycosyltransferase [Thermoguttaceae bacterium]|jgi:glycosyltransferase involved in cell wall biosynthesis
MAGKILYLSWGVPPDTAGSTIIALNLAKQFCRSEMVLAGERPYGRPPVNWSEVWPEVVYIQSVWPFTRRGIRWWRALQFPYALWKCLRLIRKCKIDYIVAVFPSAQFLLLGYLASRVTGRPLFPYFHNTYVENRTGLQRRLASWLQGRVFRHARHVFVMSEGMSLLFKERYPNLEQTPLLHTFNEPIPDFVPPPPVGSPMRFAFAGNVNASCEDAMVRLSNAVIGCPDTQLSIISGTPRRHLEELGLLREGTSYETVSRDAVLRRLTGADVVLLPHGLSGPIQSSEEYLTIFPTKTVEYLICGRAILAHSTPGSFLTRFLRENDCALVVDQPEPNALREAIEHLRRNEALRTKLVRNALRTAQRFRADRVAAEMREQLHSAMGETNSPSDRSGEQPEEVRCR